MLYSLYQRRVRNVVEEIEKVWLKVLFNSTASLIDEITEDFVDFCDEHDMDPDDYEIVVLPDVYEGDHVMNIKTQEMGIVDNVIDPKNISVRNIINKRPTDIMRNVYKWNVADVFVLNNNQTAT